MLEFHEAGDPNVNLDTITLNSVTNAWANSRDPSQQEGEPKQSWANSRDPSAEKLAEAILLCIFAGTW